MSSDNAPEQPVRAICPHAGCELRLTRYGRADWRCPVHGDVMLLLLLIYELEHGCVVKYAEAAAEGRGKGDEPPVSR